nr:tetratricopeptide repeat protein 17-like isoform X2 [Ciona intestinalis]|eukprot:XP_018672539.1 tetratricopeptide repeat protein 17-like isoform X2 [Ciona intestinalis]
MFKIFLFVLYLMKVDGSTHWMVTEDGKIQQQLESPFAMKQPHDLVAFMRQERDHDYLKKFKQHLLKEQEEIETNEDKDTDLESRHYRTDRDCRAAGKKLPEFDLFISSVLPLENKDIEIEDYIDIIPVTKLKEPNCSAACNLPYSIHAYDHLEGVQDRDKLEPQKMPGLKSTLSFLEDPVAAATAIHEALEKNSTSWVLYNLASFYWRMKGDPDAAIECIRRALHFSPNHTRDVALVNLANILHKARYTLNASVVMLHALEISDEFAVNYFSLANIYAVLGEYNESIYYYEKTLESQSDFEAAKSRLAAVQCQLKLEEKLEAQHESLQRTLEELQSYKQKHEQYVQKQNRFNALQIPAKVQIDYHMHYEHQRIREGTFNHKCQVRSNKSGSVLVCNLPPPSDTPLPHLDTPQPPTSEGDIIKLLPRKISVDFENERPNNNNNEDDEGYKLPSQVEEKRREIKRTQDDAAPSEQSTKPRSPVYDWTDPSWPPMKSCDEYVNRYPAWDEFHSAYVDPETRGISVRELLTTYIGISEGEMHPLPWKPPRCDKLETLEETQFDSISGIASRNTVQNKQDTHLQAFLLLHVNKGRVWPDDLGQRINTAMRKAIRQQDNDHLWALYNLAGLFWRVNGDNLNAIECLRRCIRRVPVEHLDIPLVSLSNIMYRVGKLSDAVNLLIYALRVNNSEPATYLSMGNALQAQDNITGAVEFYNYAMVLNPQYKDAFHSLLVVKCSHLRSQKQEDNVKKLLQDLNVSPLDSNEEPQTDEPQDDSKEQDASDIENANEVAAGPTQDEPYSHQAKEAGQILQDLVDRKSDANQLLKDTTKAIEDLNNSNGKEAELKMEHAHKLMEKLSKIRNSLDEMVTKAALALSGGVGHRNCEKDKDLVDFSYKADVQLIDGVAFPEADWSKLDESDRSEPLCVLDGMPKYYDLTDVQSIHNPTNVDAIKEEYFIKLLTTISHSTTLEEVARKLSYLLRTQQHTTWETTFLSSYYWRVKGDTKQVITCFMQSLATSGLDYHPVILSSMVDFLAVASQLKDALVMVRHLSELDSSPARHYLVGNIFAANGQYLTAADHYISSTMHGDFKNARIKMRAAVCKVKE